MTSFAYADETQLHDLVQHFYNTWPFLLRAEFYGCAVVESVKLGVLGYRRRQWLSAASVRLGSSSWPCFKTSP